MKLQIWGIDPEKYCVCKNIDHRGPTKSKLHFKELTDFIFTD